jgi:hypothetical protein
MAHDVFISYSAHDKPAAHAVCAKLESRGIRCWTAPRDIRPGMSWGGAFLPGQYTVNFYLNGHKVAERKFRVVADAGLPYGKDLSGAGGSAGGGGGAGSSTAVGIETPMVASGTIDGINGRDSVPMELRLRPQPSGFLHGELVVHLSGSRLRRLKGLCAATMYRSRCHMAAKR